MAGTHIKTFYVNSYLLIKKKNIFYNLLNILGNSCTYSIVTWPLQFC